jgi:hypothetical protein
MWLLHDTRQLGCRSRREPFTLLTVSRMYCLHTQSATHLSRPPSFKEAIKAVTRSYLVLANHDRPFDVRVRSRENSAENGFRGWQLVTFPEVALALLQAERLGMTMELWR